MCNISQRTMNHRQTASLAHWLTLLKHTYNTEMAFKWHAVSSRSRSRLICSHFILHVSVLWLFCSEDIALKNWRRTERRIKTIQSLSSVALAAPTFPFMFCVCLFLHLASTTLTVSYSVRSVILYSQTHTHSHTHTHELYLFQSTAAAARWVPSWLKSESVR